MLRTIEVGALFGRLTVIARIPGRRSYFECACACGTKKPVRADHLASGKTVSCGCYHREAASARAHIVHEANTTHGKSGSQAHNAWLGMKQRCNNHNQKFFHHYGGRGIGYCKRWESFDNFYSDMGEPQPGHTLDRKNNELGYSKSNCRWVTRQVQQNNRRVNRRITIDGITHTISEWAKIAGLPRNTFNERLNDGWDPKRAITEPNTRSKPRITHCKRGHELTEGNFYWYGNSRSCKTCAAMRAKGMRSK